LIISLLEKLGIIYSGADSGKMGYSSEEVLAAVNKLPLVGMGGEDLSSKILEWIKQL
jgi:hypothetical protein